MFSLTFSIRSLDLYRTCQQFPVCQDLEERHNVYNTKEKYHQIKSQKKQVLGK